jgi:hypothetical protein
MAGLLESLGTTEKDYLAVRGMSIFNLKTLTHRPDTLTPSSGTFRLTVSQVMAQGMRFIISPYATEGVSARNDWVFWAPILVTNKVHDAIFTARYSEMAKVWRYGLYFYGSYQRLHDRLGECVLSATAGTRTNRRIIAQPHFTQEGTTHVTSFELAVNDGRGTHVLSIAQLIHVPAPVRAKNTPCPRDRGVLRFRPYRETACVIH